jgi:hypothetical protein
MRGNLEYSSDKAPRYWITWIQTTSLANLENHPGRTSLTTLNPQLTPPHLSSCSHNRSEPRYAPSPASGLPQLTITALLDRPCRETTSYRPGNQTHFHHSYCYSSRFVRSHIAFVTSSLLISHLPHLCQVYPGFIPLSSSQDI